MPVTHGVAGSSPVRTARRSRNASSFVYIVCTLTRSRVLISPIGSNDYYLSHYVRTESNLRVRPHRKKKQKCFFFCYIICTLTRSRVLISPIGSNDYYLSHYVRTESNLRVRPHRKKKQKCFFLCYILTRHIGIQKPRPLI